MAQPLCDTRPSTLNEWCAWLSDKEMPVFSNTVRRLHAVLDDQRNGAAELARVVMADPGLSAQVLRLVNSVYYNPGRQPIATLTKAIILLGSNVVRELALTATFIESIQSAKNRDNANREIIDALHAAVQAKSLAVLSRDPSPEEVFLAALLYNIGHVAFWCFEERIGANIDHLVRTRGLTAEQAEKKVLGFRLRELGAALAKAWQLRGLVEDVYAGHGRNALRVSLVQQAHALVRLHKRRELDSNQARALLAPLGTALRRTPAELVRLFEDNLQVTASIATQYGISSAVELLTPAQGDASILFAVQKVQAGPAEDRAHILQQVQQDISSLLSGDFDLSMLFEMIIEGIQRGLPMDRTLFALLNRERTELREKSAVGWPLNASRAPLHAPVSQRLPNIFTYALQMATPVWLQPADTPGAEQLYTAEIEAQFGRRECFIAPLAINNRPIGVLYADRGLTLAPLTQETFSHFRHLSQQANIGLRLSQLQRP